MSDQGVLVLTGTPPGAGKVGGIVLRDIIRHCGSAKIECAAVVKEKYIYRTDPESAKLSVRLYRTDALSSARRGVGLVSAGWSELRSFSRSHLEILRLQRAIVARAREFGAKSVFAVLNCSMTMALAYRIANELGVPLTALVWEPPDYVLRTAGFGRYTRRWFAREFERSLARCRRVAVVSETMQRDYSKFTAAPLQILRHGRVMHAGTAPSIDKLSDRPYWLVGFAGSMYADCAFNALVDALDRNNWFVAGRPVRLRVMTISARLRSRGSGWIEFLGYRDEREADELLAECDVNYLPQPFKPHLTDLCRYAFPTKLAAYLATGRPVFVHCPSDSALGDYFDAHSFGAICRTLDGQAIINALEGLLGDQSRYLQSCSRAYSVGTTEYSEVAFRSSIEALFSGNVVHAESLATQDDELLPR